MDELRNTEYIAMNSSAEEKTKEPHNSKISNTFSKFTIPGIVIFVILFVVGGLMLFKPWSANQPEKKEPVASKKHVNKMDKDLIRAKMVEIDPAQDYYLQFYTDNKVIINLEIPKGAVKEKEVLTFIPYKNTDPSVPVKIMLFPPNVTFTQPVGLSFDFSKSTIRTDAPEYIETSARLTGKTQILKSNTDGTVLLPRLIVRPTETSRTLQTRILSGGTYQLTIDGKNQVENARKALATPKTNVLTILEAGSVLVGNKQTLSAKEKALLLSAADQVQKNKKSTIFEQYSAIALNQKLTTNKPLSFVPVAYAEDNVDQVLKVSCGREDATPEQLAVTANTAKLLGKTDIETKCMDRARTLVAEETKKLLASYKPSTRELLQQIRRVQAFKLPESTTDALQNKINQVMIEDIKALIESGADSATMKAKLQEAQLISNIGKWEQILSDKIAQKAFEEAMEVASNPNSTIPEVQKALTDAQLNGVGEGENNDIVKALQDRATRSPQEVLDAKNSTLGEIVKAYIDSENDPEVHKKLYERINEERRRKAGEATIPTPTREPTPTPENPEQGVDMSVLAVPFFKMLGGESFDEQGIKSLGKKYTDDAHEKIGVAREMCDAVDQLIAEYGPPDGAGLEEYRRVCNEARNGTADAKIDEYKREIDKGAEEVGRNQENYESFDDSESDWSISIDLSPTPEIEGEGENEESYEVEYEDTEQQEESNDGQEEYIDDYTYEEQSLESDSSVDDSGGSEGAFESGEVEGISTKQAPNGLFFKIKNWLF